MPTGYFYHQIQLGRELWSVVLILNLLYLRIQNGLHQLFGQCLRAVEVAQHFYKRVVAQHAQQQIFRSDKLSSVRLTIYRCHIQYFGCTLCLFHLCHSVYSSSGSTVSRSG